MNNCCAPRRVFSRFIKAENFTVSKIHLRACIKGRKVVMRYESTEARIIPGFLQLFVLQQNKYRYFNRAVRFEFQNALCPSQHLFDKDGY